MTSINSEYLAQNALQTLRLGVRATSKLNEQMSTGIRIHSAADDAARLAIGNVMDAQHQGIVQATRNLHDGITLAQTAEGALASITDVLQRMRELAVQAATGTLLDSERSQLDNEYQTLKAQILNTVQKTTWNGYRLFNELSSTTFELQAGPDANDKVTITIPQIYASGQTIGFTNGDFESSSVGDTSITGWTVSNSRVALDGTSRIGGWPTPIDATKPSNSGGDKVSMTSGNFVTQIESASGAQGSKSLSLQVQNVTVANFGIVHGPYIISNDAVEIRSGEKVSFDWKATYYPGGDAYDVYAYLLNTDNGSIVTMLNETGNSATASTPWAKVEITVPATGNYKFVFVSGSYDFSGGTKSGALLYIDNITAPPRTLPDLNITAITSRSAAGTSITEVDKNIESVTRARASLGASINRIYHAADNLAQRAHHIAESRSDMVDTDYAEATMHLSRLKALDVGASFVLQQSRQNSQNALGMIRSNDTFFRN